MNLVAPTPPYLAPPRISQGSELRLLRAIHHHGLMHARGWLDTNYVGLAQTDAANLTALSRASISNLAKRLRERGLLREGTRGLALDPALGIGLGADISMGQVRVTCSDLNGQLLDETVDHHDPVVELPDTPFGVDGDATITLLADAVLELVGRARTGGANVSTVLGVGISIAGPINRDTQMLKDTWGDGGDWQTLSPTLQLQERLADMDPSGPWSDTPFILDRDANASALAEALWGVGQNVRDILYCKWSEAGVAASVMSNQHILRGADGIAGEITHAAVHTSLPWSPRRSRSDEACLKDWFKRQGPCTSCKRHGCLHMVTSLKSLETYVRAPSRKADPFTTDFLLALANSYDRQAHRKDTPQYRAQHGLEVAARCLGRVLAPVIETLNPRRVILGGKIGVRAYPLISSALNEGIKEHPEVTPAIDAASTIHGARRLTGTTSVRGAIALALESAPERL